MRGIRGRSEPPNPGRSIARHGRCVSAASWAQPSESSSRPCRRTSGRPLPSQWRTRRLRPPPIGTELTRAGFMFTAFGMLQTQLKGTGGRGRYTQVMSRSHAARSLLAALAGCVGLLAAGPPAAQAATPLPAGWPGHLVIGMSDAEHGAADLRATTPLEARYHYLAGGVN